MQVCIRSRLRLHAVSDPLRLFAGWIFAFRVFAQSAPTARLMVSTFHQGGDLAAEPMGNPSLSPAFIPGCDSLSFRPNTHRVPRDEAGSAKSGLYAALTFMTNGTANLLFEAKQVNQFALPGKRFHVHSEPQQTPRSVSSKIGLSLASLPELIDAGGSPLVSTPPHELAERRPF